MHVGFLLFLLRLDFQEYYNHSCGALSADRCFRCPLCDQFKIFGQPSGALLNFFGSTFCLDVEDHIGQRRPNDFFLSRTTDKNWLSINYAMNNPASLDYR